MPGSTQYNSYASKSSLVLLTTTISVTTAWYAWAKIKTNTNKYKKKNACDRDYESLIGGTPIIHLKKLSSLIGDGKKLCVKMESMNPGGTGKDRAALFMLRDAEEKGLLPPPLSKDVEKYDNECTSSNAAQLEESDEHLQSQPDKKCSVSTIIQNAIRRSRTGGIVVEGTSGSTGISLATLSAQRGHSTIIVMPDDQAKEKQTILRCIGAIVHVVPTAAISNPNQYVNVARKIAEDINSKYANATESDNDNGKVRAVFMNQFENKANYDAHITTTGPEIWRQTNHEIDAFCMSSGTGGTISGVGQYIKSKCREMGREDCKIVLIDPPGSALLNKVKFNIAYASEQQERGLKRHRYDTIAEGIGLDRVTKNFALGAIDDAIRVTDQEALDMAHWLLKEEGLFVGSSSAMNVFGALQYATESMGPGSTIVTVICDGGLRHLSRLWNRDFVREWGLESPEDDEVAWRRRLPPCLR